MCESLTSGSVPFPKAYLGSLFDGIEVDDAQVRIKGSKDELQRAVLPLSETETAAGEASGGPGLSARRVAAQAFQRYQFRSAIRTSSS
jgi:hypothetical protein